jgi:alanine racemase
VAERRAADGRPTTARIDLAALRANYELARRRARGRDVIAVVKADAYGHGAVPVTRALVRAGASRVAVATVDEGAELRAAFAPLEIHVLGGVHSEAEAEAAIGLGLVPVLHHEGQRALVAKAVARRGIRAGVQVEIDTGMRRLGVPEDEALELLARLEREPGLWLAGVLTHFARADEPDPALRLEPLARFRRLLESARSRGIDPGLVHVANSAALLAFDDTLAALPEQGAVRPGILLYGVNPAPHLAADLAPVMTLRTEIVALRRVAAGDCVGYGGTHRAQRATRIATLPVGYADGVPFSLGNRGHVLLGKERAPIVGRVSMDLLTVDVGDAPAQVGDPVILFGVGQGATLRVEEVAEAAGTLAYEILVRIGRRVPRVFAGD